MSIQDYEKARFLINSHPEKADFVGPKSESFIRMAEDTLGVKFPPTYRKFLKDFGAGGFGGAEIYGLIKEDFENSGIPDVVWYTMLSRKKWKLPSDLIPVYDLGDGEDYCIEVNQSRGQNYEGRVIAYSPGYPPEEQNRNLIAEDFGKLLLDLVLPQIKGSE
ncbi:MAG: SMI1/KNR4 family protein [Chloroflexota bacterium]